MVKERLTGIFHLFVHSKLKDKAREQIDNIMERQEVKQILSCHTVRTQDQVEFLKEMAKYKLIKIVNKQKIQILRMESLGAE